MRMETPKKFVFYTKGIETKSFYDEKAKKLRYFAKGHIDSEELDLVNDIVTKGCMTDVQKQLKARNIKLDLDHETLRKGKGETDFDAKLNLTKIPLGKAVDESLDEKGNLVEFELNSNWKKLDSKGDVVMTFNEVWDNLKSGFYDAFSIAYVPLKTTFKSIKEGKVRLLDKINLINIALTGNPINPGATITSVMAKSLEWLKEKEEKGYEKDGAHAHTENDPLGEHNHSEIEKILNSEIQYLNDRISRLSDRIYKLESGKSESEDTPGLKNKKSKAGDTIMTEENKDKKSATGDTSDSNTNPDTSNLEGQGADESSNAAENVGAEGKSIDAKAFNDLKREVSDLKSGIDKINKVLEKALPVGYGPENKSQAENNQNSAEEKSQVTGTMDLI